MALDNSPIRGMKDYFPRDWHFITWLRDTWLTIGKSFGYEEYEAPVLEPIELYLDKTSEEIVKEQTFSLTDRKGKQLIMRPEMTPSLARMVVRQENELTFPLRWQSFGRFFRYEKPQKGRGRAFFQWNIDLIGSTSILADLEIIHIATLALQNLGISSDQASVRINNREIFQNVLEETIGVEHEKAKVLLRIIDRLEKMSQQKAEKVLTDEGLSAKQVDALFRLINTGDPSKHPWFEDLWNLAVDCGIDEYIDFDFRIIRGFDYYTGIVFEAWAKTDLRRALFGGGRYDHLTQQVGGRRARPGVGFAAGDASIYELLREIDKVPSPANAEAVALVTVFSPDFSRESVRIAGALRAKGIPTEVFPKEDAKLGKQLQYASQKDLPFALIYGPDEAKSDRIILKDLGKRTQTECTLEDASAAIQNALRE